MPEFKQHTFSLLGYGIEPEQGAPADHLYAGMWNMAIDFAGIDQAGEDKVLGAIDEIPAGEFKESSAMILH